MPSKMMARMMKAMARSKRNWTAILTAVSPAQSPSSVTRLGSTAVNGTSRPRGRPRLASGSTGGKRPATADCRLVVARGEGRRKVCTGEDSDDRLAGDGALALAHGNDRAFRQIDVEAR